MRRSLAAFICSLIPAAVAAREVHVTWLWHLEPPIYWPAPNAGGQRYETALDSLRAQREGAAHPANDLDEIFGKDDRIAVYPDRGAGRRPGRHAAHGVAAPAGR